MIGQHRHNKSYSGVGHAKHNMHLLQNQPHNPSHQNMAIKHFKMHEKNHSMQIDYSELEKLQESGISFEQDDPNEVLKFFKNRMSED